MDNNDKPPEGKPENVPDIFDSLDTMRLDQSFMATGGTKKLLTTVPLRKPRKTDWFCIHPAPDHRLGVGIIADKDEGEFYFVAPGLAEDLSEDMKPYMVFVGVNMERTYFVYPVPLAGPDGKWNTWHRSAFEGAEHAAKGWTKLVSNKDLGAYEIREPIAKYPDPDWSGLPSFREVLKLAFRDYQITTLDHPYIKKLQGR